MTWIDVNDEAEGEDIKQRSRAIAAEMARVPGFIGWVGIGIAERLYTLTLWDNPETIRQLTATAQHRLRCDKCSRPSTARLCIPASWVPDHLNPQWQRCPKCGTMIDPDRPDASCPCGEASPARRTYV
jgi:hypothetical protein